MIDRRRERIIRWDKKRYERMEKMRRRIEELRRIYPYVSSPPQRHGKKSIRKYVNTPSQARLVF